MINAISSTNFDVVLIDPRLRIRKKQREIDLI